MLIVRAIAFTLLVPVVAAVLAPRWIDPGARMQGGAFALGWVLVAAGAVIYLLSLIRFVDAGGTPAIFFLRRLRAVLGDEPASVVAAGIYRYSRNPMYLAVVAAIFGQAILFRSARITAYGAALFVFFHLIVIMVEEPHLRATRGSAYDIYLIAVPRWFRVSHHSKRR